MPRKEKQKETLKARETIYTTAPEQSTDNREPHTIRTTHHAPHETRKQADERAMEIGNKGKRQSLDIGSNEPHSSPSFLIISSEHTPHETTPSRPPPPHITAHPPSISEPLSFVPPHSPSPLSKSGAKQYGKQATPTPDNVQPSPSLSLISSDRSTHRPAGGRQ